MHSNHLKRYVRSAALAAACSVLLTDCTGSGKTSEADSAAADDVYQHADRDIAMTLGSLVDALRVGEPLDSTIYNYVGILTDGEGYSLYWDDYGYPGQWEVLVVNADSAVIRNLKSGDLRVGPLQNYISQSLEFDENNIKEVADPDGDDMIERTVYAFKGGMLKFELLEDNTPLGEEGPFLNISVVRSR